MDPRPDFMVTLGLAPPYSVEDVKQAYLMKAKTAHPDTGGDAESFRRLQEAFERGTEYAEFHESRRRWIRSRVDRYIRQEELAEKLRPFGGRVELDQFGWVRQSFDGDFAQLIEKIVGIHLTGPKVDDRVLDHLVEHRNVLSNLWLLDLAGSNITNKGLARLRVLTSLEELNLHGTKITYRGLKWLGSLPSLRQVDLCETRVGPWGRFRLRWACPNLTLITSERS